MKFIVDVMLGKLAKWLRILGYDTLYDNSYSDDDLFFKAHRQERILLTRDKELSSRMNPKYTLYITGLTVQEQVKQVVSAFNLNTTDFVFSRCTLCNSPITTIPKNDVAGKVPLYIFESTTQFYFCPTCEKIYWPGSHIKQVRAILKTIASERQHE